jgi:general secretion pathway protein D
LRPGEAGFGVTIVPLRYASAATIAKTSESFLSRPGALRADTTRNILMIQGTAAERQSAVEMITSFDVEWLRNQSVGIYPLKATSPDTMIHELERVFETAEGGQGQGMINFQPIARMNAVMAVSRSRKYIDQTSQWIRRLDKSDPSGTTIRIYRLEHGAAVKIAKILNDIFVGKGGTQAADNAANQVAPGSNAGQSKLDSLGGGLNSSGTATNNTSNTAISNNSPQPNSSLTNNSSGLTASSFDDFSGGSKKSGDNGGESGGALPKGVFQNVRITADAANNSIVIFSNQEDYNVIERSLRELDRPQMQVAIEATIAEVTLTDALQYGVQYYIGSSNIGAGTNNGSISLTTSAATAAIAQAVPGLNVLLGNQASPKVVLSALSTLTTVKVLSAPSLVVTDNQPAFLQVGDSVPISTGSATVLSSSNTVVNTITMQDTGVILKVWPHIHANGVVELEIEQQVSNVVGGVSANTTNLNPTISQRRIHSTVAVTSGQTVLLGGLMSEEDDKTKSGIPLLQQIRGIGDLFGTTNGSKSRTEIIVFVKPRIIQNSLDAQNVAQDFRAGLSTMHSNATMFSGRDVPDPRPIPPK